MPGEGVEPSRPRERTPDFKSGAYDQFRHPGAGNRSPDSDSLKTAEGERGRDVLRRLADHDRDLLVRIELDARRVAAVGPAVQVHAPRCQLFAVAANAV